MIILHTKQGYSWAKQLVYVGRNLHTGSVCKPSPVCRLGETLAQFAHRVSVCKSNDLIAQYADWLPN